MRLGGNMIGSIVTEFPFHPPGIQTNSQARIVLYSVISLLATSSRDYPIFFITISILIQNNVSQTETI